MKRPHKGTINELLPTQYFSRVKPVNVRLHVNYPHSFTSLSTVVLSLAQAKPVKTVFYLPALARAT